MSAVIVLRIGTDPEQRLPAPGKRVTVGRAPENDLAYPADSRLSRRHFELQSTGQGWIVRDLNSRNGTFVNGRRITEHRLVPGDRVMAGGLSLRMEEPAVPEVETKTTLETVLRSTLVASHPGAAERHMRALVRAGRELAGSRPIEEFFDWTVGIAVEAVEAERGAIAILQGSEWQSRAVRGDIEISHTVRDRIVSERVSLLVRDAPGDALVGGAESVILQHVRSLMAAPLQAGDEVFGLIYVDRRQLPEFSPQDLNILTMLANMAAIRLEHARLAALEQARSARIREMEVAADAQRRALHAAELMRHAETRAVLAETGASTARLAAAISHELNTPLGALKSSVETLLACVARARQGADPVRVLTVAEELSASIVASTSRLSEIVGRLQRFTNLDRADVQSIELGPFLRDVVLATQPERQSRVEIAIAGSQRVVSRPQQLAAAFAALLERTEGSAALSASSAPAGLLVLLEAREMVVEEQELIEMFDPSFRVLEGRMGTENWSLFAARQLLRELGGDVQAESDPERGLVFTVLIPAPPPDASLL